jgi:hypothetical protein
MRIDRNEKVEKTNILKLCKGQCSDVPCAIAHIDVLPPPNDSIAQTEVHIDSRPVCWIIDGLKKLLKKNELHGDKLKYEQSKL